MIKIVFIFLLGLVLIIPNANLFAEENKYLPHGPFNIRNQMPMYIFYMSMKPDMAQTLKKGKFLIEGGYYVSNTIVKQHDLWYSWLPPWELRYWMIIDAEVNRFYIDTKYGLLDNLEIGINIPYLYYSGGYLDSFIENFEDTFSFIKTPNARKDRAENVYEFKFDYYGQTIIEDYSKPDGLGEISVRTKYKLLKETNYLPTVSVSAALKLPTTYNDSSDLLGSKKIDYGFGILADKKLFERLFIYLNFNFIFIQKPDILKKLNVDSYMISGLLGLEFFLTNKISIIFQTIITSDIYEPGVPAMGKEAVACNFGFNYNFNERLSWVISMEENITSASPDFGVQTSISYKF